MTGCKPAIVANNAFFCALMFVRAYLDTAARILDQYTGGEPLPAFLKKFFAAHKKFGARDRRQITHLCYAYFRLGKALDHLPRHEKILLGLYLCSTTPQPVLALLHPLWHETLGSSLAEKIGTVQQQYPFQVSDIFPLPTALADSIAQPAFQQSFLVQPDTFLRLRPGRQQQIRAQLQDAGLEYYPCGTDCIGLPAGAKLDELLMLNRDAVVQDRSSQQVLSLLDLVFAGGKTDFSAWDCCAASGGKSIQLHDLYPNCRLTVSDIRNSILINLKKRFEQAGIRHYHAFVSDIGAPGFTYNQSFNLVLCDAPCSGSGTWGRTPEQMYFFTPDKLEQYSALQQRIARNAARQVTQGGYLLYVTCSVFAAENEGVVHLLEQEAGLQLQEMRYFEGYTHKADTLFAALLQRL